MTTIGTRSDLVAQVLRLQRLVLALGSFPADTTLWTVGDPEPEGVEIVRDLDGGFWQRNGSLWRRVERRRQSLRSRAQVWKLPRLAWHRENGSWFELLRVHGPVSDKEPLP